MAQENEIKKADGWGGARPGAGRKRKLDGKPVNFTTTAETLAIIEARPEGMSRSAYINAALLAYAAK